MAVNEKESPAEFPAETQPKKVLLLGDEISPLTIIRKQDWARASIFLGLYLAAYCAIAKPTLEDLMFFALGVAITFALGLIFSKLPLKQSTSVLANLTFSREGLELHSQAQPKFQNLIPWSKLRLVGQFKPVWKSKLKPNTSPRVVILNFADLPDIPVDLEKMSESEQEHFFRIISRYIPQRLLAPEVLFMQVQSLLGNTPSTVGFTQIWSDEFDKKFELANHVSLPAGHKCGNGRYTIELTIATRMSSSTYLATDAKGNRCVIKELVVPVSADEALQEKLLSQFDREASILASLSHHSIVSVQDHFVENERSYLLMECVPGNNIRHQLRLQGPFKQAQTIAIAKQLAEVLCYLHTQDPPVLHRDLSPDNIVYCENTNELKVVDFGAANIYHSHGTGTLIGKQGYMAPEQYKGKATPASDVYALGSTLLYMLSGEDPPGMGRMPERSLSIDPEFYALIQSCLQFEQAERPSSGKILLEQLNALSERQRGQNENEP